MSPSSRDSAVPGLALGGPAMMYDAHTNQIFQSGFGRTRSKHAPTVDPFNPGEGLKELRAEGSLRVAGEVQIDGRRAYRLVSGDVPSAGHAIQRTEIVVDAVGDFDDAVAIRRPFESAAVDRLAGFAQHQAKAMDPGIRRR